MRYLRATAICVVFFLLFFPHTNSSLAEAEEGLTERETLDALFYQGSWWYLSPAGTRCVEICGLCKRKTLIEFGNGEVLLAHVEDTPVCRSGCHTDAPKFIDQIETYLAGCNDGIAEGPFYSTIPCPPMPNHCPP